MKKIIYLAAFVLGMAFIGGCTETDNDSKNYLFSGEWRSDEGDIIYIYDELNSRAYTTKHPANFQGALYYKNKGKNGSCYEVDYDDVSDGWGRHLGKTFLIYDTEDNVIDSLFLSAEDGKLISKHNNIAYHQKQSTSKRIENKIRAFIAQREAERRAAYDEANRISAEAARSISTQGSDKFNVVGEWVFRHGKTGDLNRSQEYEEGIRFNSDMTGVYNAFIATYRGLDRTNRKRTGSFTFTWDIVGNDVYITVDGERSHAFTYSMYGTLTDSGGNAFTRQ